MLLEKIKCLHEYTTNYTTQNIYRWTNPKLNGKKETVLNRLRIGHTRITHGFLMARKEPPICQTRGTALIVKHLIADCLKFNQERVMNGISYNLDTALGPDHEKNLEIINFTKQAKLFNLS
ncbi:uncharacterized protein LOC113552556 [Rhopalosiphum maidis]|uniref:uncharacterized protein LOC113552556 n=1 Tax=Rhopalosiphum maidis TaxID=43146 RepID=UPI000EFE3C47|nr:uncharacterized protein LOC113552556 [Rhopalosiphum maidis]